MDVRALQLLSAPQGRQLCELLTKAGTGAAEGDVWSALTDVVSTANYWQNPVSRPWMTAAEPTVVATATDLAACEELAWWWAGPDLDDQWSLVWPEAGERPSSGRRGSDEELAGWREHTVTLEERYATEREEPGGSDLSGEWWSAPPRAYTTRTSRRGGPAPSVAAVLVEDEQGWVELDASRQAVREAARVFTIEGPSDWTDLVRRYALDVTHTRRADWNRLAGGESGWVIPDWLAVSKDYDGVHLSVGGYLSTAGNVLAVTDSHRTVLAGWNPDETIWLADVLTQVGAPEAYRRDADDPLSWSRR